LIRIRDQESFWPGIRDGKKLDPGSGINIPDPQHYIIYRVIAGIDFWDLGKASSQRSLSAITFLFFFLGPVSKTLEKITFLYFTTTEGFYNL
jgi:hypothetical protein